MAKQSQSIQLLSVAVLQPNPFQPRNKLQKDDLQELADSIRQHGILEPLLVAHTPAGYQIIAGERRWRAAQMADLDEVPAIIKECTPREMLEMALIENVQRTDLTPMERAYSFQQLIREFNFSSGEIAKRISKSVAYISNSLKLLELPDAIKDGLVSGLITEGHARAISGIPDAPTMIQAYKQILKEDASVRRAEAIARIFRRQGGPSIDPKKKKVYQESNERVMQWAKSIQSITSEKTKIRLSRSSRLTRITITLYGQPEDTQKDLEKLIEVTNANLNN